MWGRTGDVCNDPIKTPGGIDCPGCPGEDVEIGSAKFKPCKFETTKNKLIINQQV